MICSPTARWHRLQARLFQAFEGHFTLLAIPFFILASIIHDHGRRGAADHPVSPSPVWATFRGGWRLPVFLPVCCLRPCPGSSPATVVAIGTIVIAGMRQVGYSKEFAAGVICNAGTLGILIPPSIVMVVYAAAVEVSVGRMFLAGVLPGLLAGLLLMVTIFVMAKVKNLPKGEWHGWGEVLCLRTGRGLGPVPDCDHSGRHLWRDFHPDRGRCRGRRLCFCDCVLCLQGHGAALEWRRRVRRRPLLEESRRRWSRPSVHKDTKHTLFEAGKLTVTLVVCDRQCPDPETCADR